jgi:peptidoglycan/xylan/chitin deacetylase (PgdA/CDA1 family)
VIGGALERAGMLTLLERIVGTGGVIAYHGVTTEPFLESVHVTADTLATQLAFLAERYRVIPLREFVARRQAGRSLRGCVAVTFDDAYTGVADRALPTLTRYRLPATVFVATSFARRGGRYWWDRLAWIVSHADEATRQATAIRVTGAPHTSPTESLRAMVARGGRLSTDAEQALRVAESGWGSVPERALTEAELVALARSELIDFGCHTESHPVLPLLSEPEQRREITESYHWLADRLPRVHPLLAYPYGLYDRRTVGVARAAGMEGAFSIEGRAAPSRFDQYACPRIGMAEVNDVRGLRLRLNWSAIPLIAWRNGGWHPRLSRDATRAIGHP